MTEKEIFDSIQRLSKTTLERETNLQSFILSVVNHIITSPDLNDIFELKKYPISTDSDYHHYVLPHHLQKEIDDKCLFISEALVGEIHKILAERPHPWDAINVEELKKISKEELIEIIQCQNRHILSVERTIDQSDNKRNLRNFVYRDRSSRPTKPLKSRIDLREDGYKSNDSDEFRHTQIDIMRVIYALYKLDYFVEYNQSIDPKNNGEKDLNKQKRARMSDVFDAFGNAINISDFHDKYKQGFAKQSHSNPKSGQNPVSKDEILQVFYRMKNVMEEYCEDHFIK